MKRFLALLLVLLLLAGCAPAQPGDNTVTFYYPRKNYVYSLMEAAIGSESRDSADMDLEYLLRLYLLGPTEENLESIYPSGTQLQSLNQVGTALTIFLSPGSNRMEDISFTLAGACLARTCFGLGDFTMVTIRSGDRDISFRPDDLIFQDTSATLEDTQKEENP